MSDFKNSQSDEKANQGVSRSGILDKLNPDNVLRFSTSGKATSVEQGPWIRPFFSPRGFLEVKADKM